MTKPMNPYAARAQFTEALETYTHHAIAYDKAMVDIHMEEEFREKALAAYVFSRKVLFDIIVAATPTDATSMPNFEVESALRGMMTEEDVPVRSRRRSGATGLEPTKDFVFADEDAPTEPQNNVQSIPVIGVRRPIPFVVTVRNRQP